MDIDELEKNKFVEKLIMKTPNGGDYSEAHFFDDNWKYTIKDKATHMVIKEFKLDGTSICETFLDRVVSEADKNINSR